MIERRFERNARHVIFVDVGQLRVSETSEREREREIKIESRSTMKFLHTL